MRVVTKALQMNGYNLARADFFHSTELQVIPLKKSEMERCYES